jgi:hypothetical protein
MKFDDILLLIAITIIVVTLFVSVTAIGGMVSCVSSLHTSTKPPYCKIHDNRGVPDWSVDVVSELTK